MATATFSGRTDKLKLDFADNLTRKETGLSFGQYCSNVIVDRIYRTGKLPVEGWTPEQKCSWGTLHACLDEFAKTHGPLDDMSDDQVKDLITSRYE